MVGRAAELAEIAGALQRATRRAGSVVLISGEPGVGKSRLLAELSVRATELGFPVLSGRAVEGGGAFRPLSEALLGYLRESEAAALPAELTPFRSTLARLAPGWVGETTAPASEVDTGVMVGEAVLRLTRHLGDGGGCAMILDDLHWADPDTIAVLEYLASAIGGSAVVIGAVVGSGAAAEDLVHRLTRLETVTRLDLPRLGSADLTRMLTAQAGGVELPPEVTSYLYVRSEGLPVLARELLADLLSSQTIRRSARGWEVTRPLRAAVPPTLAALVARRTATMPPPALQLLQAAAVLGLQLDWRLLGPVTGLPEAEIVALLRMGAITQFLGGGDAPGVLSWRHGLMRDAVLRGIAPAEQALVARRAANALTNESLMPVSSDAEASAVALYVEAGEPVRAAGLWQSMARRALTLGALATATEQLERAAGLDPASARIVSDRVRALTLSGRIGEALTVGDAAMDRLSRDDHAELGLQLARAAVAGGRWREAGRYLDRAGRPDDARSLAAHADIAFGTGQVDQAYGFATLAVKHAERDGRAGPWCDGLEVLGRCAALTDPSAARGWYARAAQIAAEHSLVPERVKALVALGTAEMLVQGQSVTLLEARQLAEDSGMLAQVCSIDLILTDNVAVIEGPAASLVIGERCRELASRLRLTGVAAMADFLVATSEAMAGNLESMRSHLAAAQRQPHAPVEVAALTSCVLAFPPLLAHDLPRARDLLDEGIDALSRHPGTAPLVHWSVWLVVRAVLDDRVLAARNLLSSRWAAHRSVNRAALGYVEAIVAGRMGDSTRAVELFDLADEQLALQHWWRRLLRLLVAEAAIDDGWGDPAGWLRADLSAHEEDNPQLARTCRDLLRRTGASVRRGRGSEIVPADLRRVGVTSREMDVLVLLVEPLTNAQVAERLYLSPRTVESHVARLLQKTGTAHRAGLMAVAQRYRESAPHPRP